jgi:pseudaminic acid biosynthesis-associated methylase
MNEREQFWAGEFGTDYTRRNRIDWRKRIPFWRQVLTLTQARSMLDVGCNAGWNMLAALKVDRAMEVAGVDVNTDAIAEAQEMELDARFMPARQVGIVWPERFDLVCTSGVLIHVGKDELPEVMRAIVAASKQWVLAIEYEAQQEEEVEYRGNAERLWRRPFGALYEAMGLKPVLESGAEGYDQCRAWLLVKR